MYNPLRSSIMLETEKLLGKHPDIRAKMGYQIEKRILIADDEPFNQEALKILLRQTKIKGLKYSVDFANNGLDALKLV